MGVDKQPSFNLYSPKEKLSLNGAVKEIPQNIRVATTRKILQIHPQELMTMEKIVDSARQTFEMYNLQAKDLLASEEEKQQIADVVERTIGSTEFFTLLGRRLNWGKGKKVQDDIRFGLLPEESDMVAKNKEIKKMLITELTKAIEKGETSIKEVTPEIITRLHRELYAELSRHQSSPVQIVKSG